MKKIIIAILLVMSIKGYSQVFDVKLRVNPSNSRQLQVVFTPNVLLAGTYTADFQFTVKWATACGLSLEPATYSSVLGVGMGAAPVATDGINNYIIYSNTTSTAPIGSAPEYLIATIPIVGSGSCTFEIPPTYGASQEGDLYIQGWMITPSNAGAPSSTMAGTITNLGVVLPVELLTFKGIKKGAVSQLQWEATGEKNLVNYIIERSSDGKNFHPVGFTKPKSSNATEKVAYDFVDDQPEMGLNYYRLQSKGYGKDEKYSKVISLDFGLGLSGRVYPNPLDGDLSIDLDIESNSGTVDVSIFDVVGKQILSKKIENSDRRINMTLPTADLAPGSYIVKVKVGTFNWERKITKM